MQVTDIFPLLLFKEMSYNGVWLNWTVAWLKIEKERVFFYPTLNKGLRTGAKQNITQNWTLEAK